MRRRLRPLTPMADLLWDSTGERWVRLAYSNLGNESDLLDPVGQTDLHTVMPTENRPVACTVP